MKQLVLSVFLVSSFFLSSCKKSKGDEVVPLTTDLQITVVNELGERLTQASVTLFRLKTDYLNNINPVSTAITDSDGQVMFKNLSTINYYFYIEKLPATNGTTVYKTTAPLTYQHLNSETILIE